MSCDVVQRELSDRFTDTGTVAGTTTVEEHVASCPACHRFAHALPELRRRLRLGEVEVPPPIADQVLERLRAAPPASPGRRRLRRPSVPELARVAAVFVVAAVIGSVLVGPRTPPPARAVDLRQLVLSGQHEVSELVASVTVREHGWHPQLGARTYTGELRYGAPETLRLELSDTTSYPSPGWPANDVTVAVAEDRAWTRTLGSCPPTAMPECLPDRPRLTVTEGREPFEAADPVPLDLVVPVASFTTAEHPAELGPRTIAGRTAVGTRVTAAQLDGVVRLLTGTAGLRDVHPSDPVEVWLDAELGVPLAFTVVAGDGPERRAWARVRGFDADAGGEPLLAWQVERLHDRPARFPSSDVDGVDRSRSGPFVDGPVELTGIGPTWLPAGMVPHRQGRAGDVLVASWSDGRAWVKLRATRDHPGGRLFGGHGTWVQRVDLPDGDGVVHVAEGGRRVLVHGAGADVELTGSVAPEVLLRIAAALELQGLAVPDDWSDAASASVADARAALPGLLLPAGLDGFDGPGLRIAGDTVTATWSGAGTRGFALTQRPGTLLGPPLDDLVLGVDVRGHEGRYTPARGELQWVETGVVVSLRSTTLGLDELLAVAAALGPVS